MRATAGLPQEQLKKMFLTGCVDKRGYPSMGAALRAKDQTLRLGGGRRRNNIKDTRPYECRFCGDWHLGHNRFAT